MAPSLVLLPWFQKFSVSNLSSSSSSSRIWQSLFLHERWGYPISLHLDLWRISISPDFVLNSICESTFFSFFLLQYRSWNFTLLNMTSFSVTNRMTWLISVCIFSVSSVHKTSIYILLKFVDHDDKSMQSQMCVWGTEKQAHYPRGQRFDNGGSGCCTINYYCIGFVCRRLDI